MGGREVERVEKTARIGDGVLPHGNKQGGERRLKTAVRAANGRRARAMRDR